MNKHNYCYIFILATVIIIISACVGVPNNTNPIPENMKVMSSASENTPLPASTSTPTASPVPSNTALSTPQAKQNSVNSTIIWKASHETGDISEWQQHGGFIHQGQSAYFSIVSPFARSGKYAVALTIDTEGASNSGSFAAYLFFWDQLPGDAYYYSAWYYIPAGTQPQLWWNIFQWKSTYNGNTDDSVPMYIIDILEQPNGQLALHLVYRPDINEKIDYRQNKKTVPTDQWFHIEAYYRKAVDQTGQVIVWQDGEELINLSDVQTTMKDNTVYWSVNHYTDFILPNPSTIFIDDAVISTERIGPDYTLPD
jgi:hypothetical protein